MRPEQNTDPSPDFLPEAGGTILVVDDVPDNLAVLGALLQPHYDVLAAPSGTRALEICSRGPVPDLILLDVMMPGMDGYEVLEHLRWQPATRDIPVIFLTALDDPRDEEQGLALGAADYITKPIHPAVVLARVRNQLEIKRAREMLHNRNLDLESEVARRMAENDMTQLVTIRALAHLAETRDPETGNHILRTQGYVRLLATRLQVHPRFQARLDPGYIELLTRSAPLHDIGKVGIPDHILLKPGPLGADEWIIMKTHSRLGAEAIELAEGDIEQPVPFLALAKEIARWHHERWDGSGYPDGLRGDEIPVSARLMAVADVFDALISDRIYKAGMSYADARKLIEAGRGQHFDPDVVDAFLSGFDAFVDIAEHHRDVHRALSSGGT